MCFNIFKYKTLELKTIRFLFFLLVGSLLMIGKGYAQKIPVKTLKSIVSAMDTFQVNFPVEKAYLQLDKSIYALGDTLWFKGYLFNASYISASKKSGLMYLEIENEVNHAVLKRISVPVVDGLTWGNIGLDTINFAEGNYVLRAYTNWMRNFKDDYVFIKRFYINNSNNQSWLVNTQVKIEPQGENIKAKLGLKFMYPDKQPILLQDLEIKVISGKKVIYKEKTKTSLDGLLTVNFNLPSNFNRGNLLVIATESGKDDSKKQLRIPVSVDRLKDIDLQFMPEGGELVDGLPTVVAFKAIAEDGKSIDIAGKVYNSKQEEVVSFKSLHKGMGVFEFLPKADEKYTAKISTPGATDKLYVLPEVKTSGTVLRVNNPDKSDSVYIRITVSQDLVEQMNRYYLIGQSRELVFYAAGVNLKQGFFNAAVSKRLFPPGILRFSLLDAFGQPLNERITYIPQKDSVDITILENAKTYSKRDSIALQIVVKDKNGMPIEGSFSMAVTDNGQVKIDSIDSGIKTYLLLTSDLKGLVEDPGYYLQPQNAFAYEALDNLLLTQGWVGYSWADALSPLKQPMFAEEHDTRVTGRVLNAFNKPLVGSPIMLLSKKPLLMLDAVTGKDGSFVFANFPVTDSASYFIQARNKAGKSFNVGVEVNKFVPPAFKRLTEKPFPANINADSTLLNFTRNVIASRKQKYQELSKNGRMLKQIEIRDKKTIPGSRNLNGPGEADQVIDATELKAVGDMNLYQLIVEKIKGFGVGFSQSDDENPSLQPAFVINSVPVTFYFDGKTISGDYEDLRYMLMNYSATAIKGVEVLTSRKYIFTYDQYNNSSKLLKGGTGKRSEENAIIEITTFSGVGWYTIKTPGITIYRPVPISRPQQFYRPRYAVKNTDLANDFRSTIHWEPNIVTDKAGKASVSFYSSDNKGTYTIIIEGSDMRGNVGFKKTMIKIK